MEEFKITELIDGRPQNVKNDKEKECYDILDKLDIQYQRVEYNFFPSDKDNLKKIDKTLQVEGIKNLIFKSKNKDEFYFIIISRNEKFDEKDFRTKYNLSKLSMAKTEDLQRILNTSAGSVSIMELIYDENNDINVYVDGKLLEREYFRFHPNQNTSTIRIKMSDLKNKLMPYLKHDLNII